MMDKAERIEFLRLRFLAIGGSPYVPSGKPRRVRYSFSGRPICMAWADNGRRDDRAPDWIRIPNPKPNVTLRTKYRNGVPALASIAQRPGKKLIKAFQNAETFAASRKLQSQP